MTDYPMVPEAKQLIIDIGRRMYDKGFVSANDGNISCKISDTQILTTPTLVSKGFMTPDMLVIVNLDGTPGQEYGEYRPSTEVKMHLRAYNENPNIMAVCHAHPPVATSFAIAGIPLDQALMTECVLGLGCVPIAKYATSGTDAVADSIAPFVNDYNAVLMANHGALTWGDSLLQAYFRLESVEMCALISMNVNYIIGKYNLLSKSQVDELIDARKNRLGVTTGGMPVCADVPCNDRDVLPGDLAD